MNKSSIPHAQDKAGQTARNDKPLPRRIVELLLARIFVGELKPGDKLPPDRVLAEQLGVDRTSLRAALSELAGRNIVKAIKGSGVIVLDYREHAGLDFLDAVFAMPDIDLGSAFNMELLNHWNVVMPAIVKAGLSRATHLDLAALDRLFMRQFELLAHNNSAKAIAEVEVEIQDYFVNLAGSIILRLFANSMRRLRRQFTATFFRNVDVREHITIMRSCFQDCMAGKTTPEAIAEDLQAYLVEKTRSLRERLCRMPSNPSRRIERKWGVPAEGRMPEANE